VDSLDVAIQAMTFYAARDRKAEPTCAPTQAQLDEAHQMLGCSLPPSFLSFMQKAGDQLPANWDMYWVGGPDMMLRNIVIANDMEREHETSPLPGFLVTFFEDANGDQYCFDLRRSQGNAAFEEEDIAAVSDPIAEPSAGSGAEPEVSGKPMSLLDPVDEEAVRQQAVKLLFNKDTFGDNEQVRVQACDQREYPIVIWDRTQGIEQLDEALCIVAGDFVEWLKEYVHEKM